MVIVFFNILLFIPQTFTILKNSGGPMGISLIALPILIFFHLLLILAIISINKRFRDSTFFLIVNILAVILYGIYFIEFNIK